MPLPFPLARLASGIWIQIQAQPLDCWVTQLSSLRLSGLHFPRLYGLKQRAEGPRGRAVMGELKVERAECLFICLSEVLATHTHTHRGCFAYLTLTCAHWMPALSPSIPEKNSRIERDKMWNVMRWADVH